MARKKETKNFHFLKLGIYRTTTHHLLHQHISKGDGNGFQPELVRQEVSVLRSDFNDR